jgi:hypothetical protein
MIRARSRLSTAVPPASVSRPRATMSPTSGSRARSRVGPCSSFRSIVPGTTQLATGPLLAFTSLESESELNGATFRAVASNSIASVTSAEAKLVIAPLGDLKITQQLRIEGLTDGVVLPAAPGQPNPPQVSLSVTAEGSGLLAYQWRKDGVAIGSGTSSTFSLGAAANALAGVYDVVISNDANFVYSTPVTLVVDPHLVSVSVPASAALGDGLRFEAKAVSSKPISYKWRHRASATAAPTECGQLRGRRGRQRPRAAPQSSGPRGRRGVPGGGCHGGCRGAQRLAAARCRRQGQHRSESRRISQRSRAVLHSSPWSLRAAGPSGTAGSRTVL